MIWHVIRRILVLAFAVLAFLGAIAWYVYAASQAAGPA